MQDLLPVLGDKVTDGVVLLVVLYWLSKRISKVEYTVDRKLNNGIGSRLRDIDGRLCRIEGKMEPKD